MRLFVVAMILLGFLLVVVPLWLAIVAAAGVAMPWLLFAFAAWAIFAAGRGPRRHRLLQGCCAAAPGVDSRTDLQWRGRPLPRARPRPPGGPPVELPIDVQVKVEQIRRKVEVLLSYAPRFPPFSRDLYLVRQTADEYLPRTIEAYLALPPGVAERPLAADGRTALQELREQLNLLDSKLNEIALDLQRRDLDRLLANRRFLEERFGRPQPASSHAAGGQAAASGLAGRAERGPARTAPGVSPGQSYPCAGSRLVCASVSRVREATHRRRSAARSGGSHSRTI